MSDLATVTPEVRTLARPTSVRLLSARHETQRSPELRAAFVQSKAEGWSADKLADTLLPLLEARLEGTTEELHQAALYLADEYQQIGDSMLIVSRETGKVIARITEADVWQPPETRREDGSLVKPLPRLRPELHGFLVQTAFDAGNEARVRDELARRATSTEYLAQEGNPRLRVATRAGRLDMVSQIRSGASELLGNLRGLPREFLQAFDVTTVDGTYEGSPVLRSVAFSRTRTNIADQRTVNLSFDVLAHQQGAIGAGWVREILRAIALAHPDVREVSFDAIQEADLDGAKLWAGNHAVVSLLRILGQALYMNSDRAVGFKPGKVGTLVIHPDTCDIRSREVFDRWEVAASIEFTAWVDWSRIVGREIKDAPIRVDVLGL